ncbi:MULTISPECIES: hypothetical protein [Bacillus]|nr:MULTISPECIES: hypothetical protein [Bacillus]
MVSYEPAGWFVKHFKEAIGPGVQLKSIVSKDGKREVFCKKYLN